MARWVITVSISAAPTPAAPAAIICLFRSAAKRIHLPMGCSSPPQILPRSAKQSVSNGYILFLLSISGSIITFIGIKSIDSELYTEIDNNMENKIKIYVNLIFEEMSKQEAINHNLLLFVTIGNKLWKATERQIVAWSTEKELSLRTRPQPSVAIPQQFRTLC